MARRRDPVRDEAKKLWLESDKKLPLKDIADRLGKKPSQIRKWKSTDKWELKKERDVTKDEKINSNVTNQKERSLSKATQALLEDNSLTDKRKMFCLYYLQRFNATWAYMKAYDCDYETAHSLAYRLMADDGIKSQLAALKKEIASDLYVTIEDVANEWAKQSFSDIGDYLEFGTEDHLSFYKERKQKKRKDVTRLRDSIGPFFYQPNIDPETGKQKIYKEHFVNFKDSNQVDTSLIKSVRIDQGQAVVELYDKRTAQTNLMKYLSQDTDQVNTEQELAKYFNKLSGTVKEPETDGSDEDVDK